MVGRKKSKESKESKEEVKVKKYYVTTVGNETPDLTEEDKTDMTNAAIAFLRDLDSQLDETLVTKTINKFEHEARDPEGKAYKKMEEVQEEILKWLEKPGNNPWQLLVKEDGGTRKKFIRKVVLPLLPESARHKQAVAEQALYRYMDGSNMAASMAYEATGATITCVYHRLKNLAVILIIIFSHEYNPESKSHMGLPVQKRTEKGGANDGEWDNFESEKKIPRPGIYAFEDEEVAEMAPLMVAMGMLITMLKARKTKAQKAAIEKEKQIEESSAT